MCCYDVAQCVTGVDTADPIPILMLLMCYNVVQCLSHYDVLLGDAKCLTVMCSVWCTVWQAVDITDPNPVMMLLLVAHLFHVLPNYLPKATMEFTGTLHSTVTRQVSRHYLLILSPDR